MPANETILAAAEHVRQTVEPPAGPEVDDFRRLCWREDRYSLRNMMVSAEANGTAVPWKLLIAREVLEAMERGESAPIH